MPVAKPKDPLWEYLNHVNQFLKRFKSYIFHPDMQFIGTSAGGLYSFMYDPSENEKLLEGLSSYHQILDTCFSITDGAELYAFLTATKGEELYYRKGFIESKTAGTFALKKERASEIEQYYSSILIDRLEETMDDDNLIVSNESKLFINSKGVETSSHGLIVDDVADLLRNVVGKQSDHTLPLLEISDNRLDLFGEMTSLKSGDNSSNFIILDSHAFKKIKFLSKETPEFNIYKHREKHVFQYGVRGKENFLISVSGVMRL